MERAGYFELITGPMFSGKTETLITVARSTPDAVFIKPALDSRHAVLALSHGGKWIAARSAADEDDICRLVGRHRVVLIDEVQFFGPLVSDVIAHLRGEGRKVHAAGLDLDFLRRPFGAVPLLVRAADHVTKLVAVCGRCGAPARYTQRILDGEPAPPDDGVIRVGGAELYEPRCHACYRPGVARAA